MSQNSLGVAGFTFSQHAFKKVSEKRKRKGLAEPLSRKNNMYTQWLINSLSIFASCTFIAPLERARILKQTKNITRPEYGAKISTSSLANLRVIIAEQGLSQLWRGNTALIYKNTTQLTLKLIFFDKFKHYFMPFERQKYTNFQYFFRAACSSVCCMSLSFFLTYPFDLIHTRATAEMSPNGRLRVY
jgi:solute carrier family 25 (adenine nucleotide translocator) protein 4/5/6/31